MIDGRQCRAARGWLGMEAQELAQIAGINRDTLRRFERGEYNMRPAALEKVRATLEERGVAFTFTRDGEPLGLEDRGAREADEETPYQRLVHPARW